MKRVATTLVLFGLLIPAASIAEDVVMIGPAIGNPFDGQYATGCVGDVKHSQPPTWDNGSASQDEEIQGQDPGCVGSLVSEAADDFPGGGPPITGVRWWGISFGLESDCPPFGITIYADGGTCPGPRVCEQKPADKQCETVDGFPGAFSYEHCGQLDQPCEQPDAKYWIGIQAHYCRFDGGFQGNQWFWAMTDRSVWGPYFGNEICFISAFFSFPNWVPGSLVFGAPYDQNFELFAGAVPTTESTWGMLKDLYR